MNIREKIKHRIKELDNEEIQAFMAYEFEEVSNINRAKLELLDLIIFIDNSAYDEIGEKLK